jgi:hypothetical protein
MPKKKTAGKKTSAKKASGTAAEPTMSKAAFVRSQPRDMPTDAVIAKAKEAGLTIDAQTVYKHRPKKKGAKKSSVSPKKTTAKRASGTTAKGEKGNRVRALAAKHPEWPKSKIAKRVGCTPNYVYSVLKDAGQGGTNRSIGPSSSNGSISAFYRAVKTVGGVGKAKELLANIEAYENA